MDIIKQYKDLRAIVKQSKWGTRLKKSKSILHKSQELEFGLYRTAKELILKRCTWYYKYKKLFYNHLSINLAAIIESGQPSYHKGYNINDNELRSYDKNLNPFDFNIPESSTNPAE